MNPIVTTEDIPGLVIGGIGVYLILKIYDDLKKRFDWGGEQKYKEDKKKYDDSSKYLDDVYTVKLFCYFMMETYSELIDKIKKDDCNLSNKFIEKFKSKYYYYMTVRDVVSLVDKIEINYIEELLEETKIDKIDYGYSLDWTDEDDYLDGLEQLSKLSDNLNGIIEDGIKNKNSCKEKLKYNPKQKIHFN